MMRGVQPWKTNRSRVLRSAETSAEAKLWGELRNRQLGGKKFVRQAPVGPYFVDFLCRELKLVVEVDGGTHSTDAEVAADRDREAHLRRLGYRVVRAGNQDVHENLGGVIDELIAIVEGRA
jgi:very-short-patch-repair endonuclease